MIEQTIHPLSSPWHTEAENIIRDYCRQLGHTIIGIDKDNPSWSVTTDQLCNLRSHDSPISDTIIYNSLSVIWEAAKIPFLSTNFITQLLREGWSGVWPYFTSCRRGRYCRLTRPWKLGEPVLIIPCHVNASHWVLVHWEINGRVISLYAHDLNSKTAETSIKTALRRDHTFFPASARWITCSMSMYHPHSNKCDPRALLAMAVLATHPLPRSNMLRP